MEEQATRQGGVASGHLRRDGVLIGLLILIMGVGVGYGANWGPLQGQVLLTWIALAGLHSVLAVTAVRVARARSATRTMRRVWTAMAVAGASYTVGDLVQLVMVITGPLSLETILGGKIQSLAVVVGSAVLVGTMLTTPTGWDSGRQRIQYWLDVSIVMVAATTFGCYSFVPGPSGPTILLLGLLTGPGIFLLGVFAIVKLALGENPPMNLPAGLTISAAATLEAVAQAINNMLIQHGRLSWHLGLTLIASALLTAGARIQRLRMRNRRSMLRHRHWQRFSALPYAAIAATNVFLACILASRGVEGRVWIAIGGTIISSALVVGRQLAAFTDNRRLVDELDATVRELQETMVELQETMDERDELTAQLHHKAFHDGLTGLPNRRLFVDRLRNACEESDGASQVAVMLVDLDDFKPVNDTFGHSAGDEVLVAAAQRMRRCVGETGLVARIGGDEFAILIERPGRDVEHLARRIATAVSRPYQLTTAVACITASIGVVLALRRSASADQLLVDADTAMYEAKNSGKSGYRFSPAKFT